MAAKRVTGHLKLLRRKSGSVWYLKTRVPGRRPEQTTERLGPAWTDGGRPPTGHYTRKMAQDALNDYLAAERRKIGDGAYTHPESEQVTFGEAAAEYVRYVEHVRKIDAATVKDYRGVIDGYLLNDRRLRDLGLEPFSDRPIKAITPDDIDRYKEALIAATRPVKRPGPDGSDQTATVPALSSRVIVRHLTVLHGIFKRAKRAYGLAANPASADLVERPKVVYTGEFDTLDRSELDLLANAAADLHRALAADPATENRAAASRWDSAIYKVAAFTGLRQGELLALRWKDVDFVAGLLHIRRNFTDRREKVPKGKKVRSVPMTPDVVDVLGRLKERELFTGDDDLVFCSTLGSHVDAWSLRRRFYRALDMAGLRRIRFHDLRHHFGTAAITVLDAYSVQSYMGHSHYSTTQRYLHHKPRREDAQRLHGAFAAQSVSPDVSRNGENGAQLSATERP